MIIHKLKIIAQMTRKTLNKKITHKINQDLLIINLQTKIEGNISNNRKKDTIKETVNKFNKEGLVWNDTKTDRFLIGSCKIRLLQEMMMS